MSPRREKAGVGPGGARGNAEAVPSMTFEQAVTRLEQLVREMEAGRLGLDESLAAFEEGTALVRFCGERLSAAEKTVQRLVAEMGGSFRLEPFEEGGDDET